MNNSFSQGQILLDSTTNRVSMPKNVYKAIRTSLYTKDTLISNQKEIIAQKDSIIKIDSLKSFSFNRQLDQKNQTIDTLIINYNKLEKEYVKEKTSYFTSFKLWLGITGGLILGILIEK